MNEIIKKMLLWFAFKMPQKYVELKIEAEENEKRAKMSLSDEVVLTAKAELAKKAAREIKKEIIKAKVPIAAEIIDNDLIDLDLIKEIL